MVCCHGSTSRHVLLPSQERPAAQLQGELSCHLSATSPAKGHLAQDSPHLPAEQAWLKGLARQTETGQNDKHCEPQRNNTEPALRPHFLHSTSQVLSSIALVPKASVTSKLCLHLEPWLGSMSHRTLYSQTVVQHYLYKNERNVPRDSTGHYWILVITRSRSMGTFCFCFAPLEKVTLSSM